MYRKITLLGFMALVSLSSFAGGGWATTAVSITKDGGTPYLYTLNSEGWAKPDENNYLANTPFNFYDFGTPTSLILDGGAGCAWADGGDWYDETSFVLYYRVYISTATPGSWSQISLNTETYNADNDRRYDKTGANIDLLALATASGTYTLEVAMSKKQFYFGGNWNSMVPGGQAVAYENENVGYIASFTKSISTSISIIESSLRISTETGKVTARFDGKAQVQLFTCAGQLISSTTAKNEFSKSVKSGAYLLRIDGKSHKVLVQ